MLESRLSDLKNCGISAFQFAGFTFPKHVWTLPRGDFKKRIESHTPGKRCTGDYYHAPRPVNGKGSTFFFYLESDGMPAMRWQWADEVDGARIDHTGWYCDEFGDGEKLRGLVFRLSGGRGFLAGWSMGKGMASTVECEIYEDEVDAAYAADSIAEHAAENERDYQESERQRIEREEAELEESESAYWNSRDIITQ